MATVRDISYADSLSASALRLIWAEPTEDEPWRLDLTLAHFISPSALVLLECLCRKYNNGLVEVIPPAISGTAQYLERMLFYDRIGRPVPKRFQSHDPEDRFYELTHIDRKTLPGGGTTIVADQLGKTMSPRNNEMKFILTYCVSELMNNALKHSYSIGTVAAQYFPKNGEVEVAVADLGVGLKTALHENLRLRRHVLTDKDAVIWAKKPHVSGKAYPQGPYHDQENMGMGLYILSYIAKATGGFLCIWSGTALSIQYSDKPEKFHPANRLAGTIVYVRLNRNVVYSLAEMIKEAQDAEESREVADDVRFR